MKFTDARFKEEMGLHPQPGRTEILSWIDDSPDPDFNPNNTTGSGRENESLVQQRSIGENILSFDSTDCFLDLEGSSNNDIFLQRKMPNRIHWSIPWSDLMMTMFILFVVMFIYHSSQKEFLSPDGLKTKETKAHTTNLPPLTDNKVVVSQDTTPTTT